MAQEAANTAIDELRARIAHLEGAGGRAREALPFGVAPIDGRLPGGGLAPGQPA